VGSNSKEVAGSRIVRKANYQKCSYLSFSWGRIISQIKPRRLHYRQKLFIRSCTVWDTDSVLKYKPDVSINSVCTEPRSYKPITNRLTQRYVKIRTPSLLHQYQTRISEQAQQSGCS